MKNWTKEKSILYLDELIYAKKKKKKSGRKSADHTRWVSNTLNFLEETLGKDSQYYLSIKSLPWQETGNMIIDDPRNIDYELSIKHNGAFLRNMEQAKGILLSAKDQFGIDNTAEEVKTELDEKLDEIIQKLTNLGYGQEIIFKEIEELRGLQGKLSKTSWSQLLKGKLFDLAVDNIINKATAASIFEFLTNKDFKLLP